MDAVRAAYDEVYAHTMGRPGFILPHAVDAFAVQTASAGSKPIGVVFGLVGLYLQVERQFRAVRSRRYTWNSDVENERSHACICSRIEVV